MSATDEKHVTNIAVSNGLSDELVSEDLVKGIASNGNIMDDGLQRGLKGRHLQMIALGGVVGYVVL